MRAPSRLHPACGRCASRRRRIARVRSSSGVDGTPPFFRIRWLRPVLRRMILPVAVTLKRLAAVLRVLSFGKFCSHAKMPGFSRPFGFGETIRPANARAPRTGLHRCLMLPYFGARISVIVRPSIEGGFSTAATSAAASCTRSSSLRANSGCVISRLRNRTTTFTLSPSFKNLMAFLTLKSKSWSSVPGRSQTPFRSPPFCFLCAVLVLLRLLVFVLPVVHDPADRRNSLWRDLYQVQSQFLGPVTTHRAR